MMQRLHVILAGWVTLVGIGGAGCAPEGPKPTGFLSDYSKLEQDGGDLRYIDEEALPKYRKFMVAPVSVHFHEDAVGVHVDEATQKRLAKFMRQAIIEALDDRYEIVTRADRGVARVFVAITDLKRNSKALDSVSDSEVADLGLGGASLEAELLDSRNNQQIAAAVLTDSADELSLHVGGIGEWSRAEAVMTQWAKNFRQRLDAAYDQ